MILVKGEFMTNVENPDLVGVYLRNGFSKYVMNEPIKQTVEVKEEVEQIELPIKTESKPKTTRKTAKK